MGKPQAFMDANKAFEGYSASAHYFAEREEGLRKKHPDQWVAIYRGKVRAVAATFDDLIRQIEQKNIPTSETLARRLESNPKTLIL